MYIVIEIQTMQDGSIGNFVFSYDDRNEAEAKMHTVLATAALSSLPRYAAVLLDNNGSRLGGDVYIHESEPEEELEA